MHAAKLIRNDQTGNRRKLRAVTDPPKSKRLGHTLLGKMRIPLPTDFPASVYATMGNGERKARNSGVREVVKDADSGNAISGGEQEALDKDLIQAAKNTDVEEAERSLDKGANKNATNGSGKTVLMIASERAGGAGVVELLISREAFLDAQDDQKWTALMHSAAGNRIENATLLTKAGADTSIEGNDGTAYEIAEALGHTEMMTLLKNAADRQKAAV